jgi:hypothetical protein
LSRVFPAVIVLLALVLLPMIPVQADGSGTVVSIPDATVSPGAQIIRPINITNITNVGAITIWLCYNPTIVTIPAGGIANGNMGALASSSINNITGEAKMTWFSATGTTGDFVFAYVTLKAGNVSGSSPLDIQVKTLADLNGTSIAHTVNDGTFTVDATPPSVTALTPDPALLSDAQVGAGKFRVTVDFSEAMNTTVNPIISFAPSIASTLSFSSGAWSYTDTYVATYNVADAGVTVPGVNITVSGARDVIGNTQNPYTANAVFAIDTQNPTVEVAVSDSLISKADAGSIFRVWANFSEAMDAGTIPSCNFTPNVSSTLTPSGGAWGNGNQSYIFNYTIADANVEVSGVNISINGGKDAHGNLQLPKTATNKFDIDTKAPTIISTSPASNAVGVASDAIVNATFSEAIQDGPNFGNIAINPNPGNVTASINSSNRVNISHDNFAYSGNYTVTIPSEAIEDSAGNPNTGYSWNFTTMSPLMEGDVTLNGHVNIVDAMFIAQWVVSSRTLSADQRECADTFDTGNPNIADAMHIAQWVVDPNMTYGVLKVPLWQSPADDHMLHPQP